MSICNVNFNGVSLKTSPFERNCRYHKVQGQGFTSSELFPKGFCPHAYRTAYPYCLSLLYGSQYPSGDTKGRVRSVEIKCPASENSVLLEIETHFTLPSIVRALKNASVRLAKFILKRAGEFPDKKVTLKVLDVRGECPLGIKKGEVFNFNVWDRRELCPASFYNLYPMIMRHATAKSNSDAGGNKISVSCPDPSGVCYETVLKDTVTCDDFFSIETEAVKGGECPEGHREGDRFKFDEVLPGGLCPLAFYTIFPYYLTLTHGGNFEWVRKGENVRVQCPKSDGVAMEAELLHQTALGRGTVRVSIVDVKGLCPRQHKKGEVFNINSEEKGLCLRVMANLIPFKVNADRAAGYTCPRPDDSLVFKVE